MHSSVNPLNFAFRVHRAFLREARIVPIRLCTSGLWWIRLQYDTHGTVRTYGERARIVVRSTPSDRKTVLLVDVTEIIFTTFYSFTRVQRDTTGLQITRRSFHADLFVVAFLVVQTDETVAWVPGRRVC